MRPDIKNEWLIALRSGDYLQGTGQLHVPAQEDCSEAFCCLGVLTDLHRKQYGGEWREPGEDLDASYADFFGTLSSVVRDWAGLGSSDPCVMYGGRHEHMTRLNDSFRLPFTQIADLIEEHL
jgi:hypothetical protein